MGEEAHTDEIRNACKSSVENLKGKYSPLRKPAE
jgi:hypothetical protein